MTTKTVPLYVDNPTLPDLQPVGDPFYNNVDYWYKNPTSGEWEPQIPSRTCSTGWEFATQESDGKTTATCIGTDSSIPTAADLCGQGWTPQRVETKRVLCGIHTNSGSQCNQYTGWPDTTDLPDNYYTLNLVTDDLLYCEEQAIPVEELLPMPEEQVIPVEELLPMPEETPLTPLTPLTPTSESFVEKYMLEIVIGGGVLVLFILATIAIFVLQK